MKYFLCGITACLFLVGKIFCQSQNAPSAPVAAEVFAGDHRISFQMVVSKQFKPKSRLGFLSVSYFAADYNNKDKSKNESMIPVLVNYTIAKGFGVTAGAALNSNWGFRPFAGLQYQYANREILAVVVPGFYLNDTYNFETLTLFEYKPDISKKLRLYLRVQALYNRNTDDNEHDRSYLYVRAGITANNLSFGEGANFDRYGPKAFRLNRENYGLFLKADLF